MKCYLNGETPFKVFVLSKHNIPTIKDNTMLSSVTEIWKEVENNPKYEVSDLGQIRNKETFQILKPFRNNSGYLVVKFIRSTI